MSRAMVLALLLALWFAAPPMGMVSTASAADVIVNGDFEACPNGADLRRDSKGQDWYESRRDGKEGRALLKLSTKDIGGNATRKAMIKAHPERNTYLSHRFSEPQTERFEIRYDIYVREILPDDNRSAFFFVGHIWDKKGGPNSTGSERFVILGFENADQPGKMNLFARESDLRWKNKTIVARGLDLETWYSFVVDIDVEEAIYRVMIEDVTDWFELESFYYKDETPAELTHLSFASWNDGAGTFYVDNVSAQTK